MYDVMIHHQYPPSGSPWLTFDQTLGQDPAMDVYAAGAAAAFTVDVLVYPLDTLKTRYQSQDYIKTYASGSNKPLAIRGLYQGIGSVVLATLPAAGLFFSTYEKAKHGFSKAMSRVPEPVVHSLASGVAEMASCVVLAPAEVVKQNAQMLRAKATCKRAAWSSSAQAFAQLAGPGASRRLFTGYTALVARNLPFTALQFPMFEAMRSRLWAWRRGRHQETPSQETPSQGLVETGLVAGASAGAAGAVAAFATTPSDVVKTRMMLNAATSTATASANQGSWAMTQLIYRQRGIRGFFRGGLFRSAWTALGSSLYLGTYDTAKLWLRRSSKPLHHDWRDL
ncbi:hypothetical protein CDD82_1433 [Ophiocordyceps australis]|uniref:Mitochondrial carrier protein n=1 Tax=Ophiocordyceps australis TaxID=1399860 RepID=A0A2C5XZ32_9HYPO|nr:hypothetical protein CDD82_1433 [Ophiocordyceps australis]